MNRERVLRVLADVSVELRARFGVRSLSLFGSVARGEAKPGSDIDLLVELEGVPGLSDYMAAKSWLEDSGVRSTSS
jgi:hypothetical protein